MTSRSTIFTNRWSAAQIAGALAGIALLAIVFVHGGYFVTVIGFAAIYGIFCTGLNFFMGYAGIPPLGIGRFELTSDRQQLVVLVIMLLIGVWIAQRLKDSRFGRALRAIAGSEAAANALGIDIARYKLAAFVVAAVYASVAGPPFAHFIGFIS